MESRHINSVYRTSICQNDYLALTLELTGGTRMWIRIDDWVCLTLFAPPANKKLCHLLIVEPWLIVPAQLFTEVFQCRLL